MEKAFKLPVGTKLHAEYKGFFNNQREQMKLIKKFFLWNGIETTQYCLAGDGRRNVPFDKEDQSKITLGIAPIGGDLEKFGKELKKANAFGVCNFRKNSILLTGFQEFCVEEKMVVNLMEPDLSDHFDSIVVPSYVRHLIPIGEDYLLRVECDQLRDGDLPEGAESIPLSEFYRQLEILESQEKGNSHKE